MSSRICVAVRKRPIADPELDIVETPTPRCIVNEPKIKYDLSPYTDRHTFTFDEVFGETCNNAGVYQRCCLPLIDTVFNYGNATCFAYGQTGSGKTYTMLGSQKEPGLYAIAAREIFARANDIDAVVYVSFYEIYGRKIFDLLNNRKRLFAREDADKVINICGLSEHQVTDIQEIFDVITAGSAYRAAGQTSANAESSRSHAVLQVEVRETRSANARRAPKTIGRISFIDLAGNERGADTFDCDRKTRMEGAEINKSLLALKECIRALGMGKSHVPFRGSILTEVLRDSFTGNSRTTMISTISPSSQHCVNTLNTLRYTQRVKDLGGGGIGGGAKIEQVAGSPPGRRPAAPRRKPFEAIPAKNRPEWVSDFASDPSPDVSPSENGGYGGESDGVAAGAAPRNAAKPRGRQPSVGRSGGTPPPAAAVVKVKDPKIATIVQNHIAALESDDDDDDIDDDCCHYPRAAEGGGVMQREEERQVRKVHAYVVEEIAKAEDKLIALHRRHIDSKMTGIKEEITAIQSFEESDSVDEYVARVRVLLMKQRDDMNEILAMLNGIGSMLRDEEDLSKTLTSSVSARR
ncbi:Kinesin-13 3 [Leishmania donovani]|uniref:Kinesin-like protein n=3 Tax=Leishmania donovani species complex TaxID=38574 RepID=A0A6L0XH53_LEIIN|nr:putative MCAK-like kinesin [Leishmania infantum JPCM5]XP_003861155.1 MCAK-like kinesin, putative [Leishmania donovani]CAC9491252.1 Kinesin-13_3_-_putative [Leishmania infantum]AYU79147.1 Kinesin-13 3, putative [Leishmania donovani]CAJ1989139.1 Kinesin-13 3 [Leishmania donovani]CAM68324.1 putative MCAK-like kinesin [Leishmania infantum JPCM5]CBZ34453.1 MCAK-like kinesin, putative [Leishmania donovani]|eukprot:XP_001465893.1 putative MCAK-like kinesin [Leishmania infantum JPCM5]